MKYFYFMGRQKDPKKEYKISKDIFKYEIRPELKQLAYSQLKELKKRIINDFSGDYLISHRAKFIEEFEISKTQILKALNEFSTLTDFLNWLREFEKLLKESNELKNTLYHNYLSDLTFIPYSLEYLKFDELQNPILDGTELNLELSRLLSQNNSVTERLDYCIKIRREIIKQSKCFNNTNQNSNKNFVEIKLHRKGSIYLSSSNSLNDYITNIDFFISCQRIRMLPKNFTSQKTDVLIENVRRCFILLALNDYIFFHPFDSFIKSEIITSLNEVNVPRLKFKAIPSDSKSLNNVILSLTTLCELLFDFKKQELKYWIYLLGIPNASEPIIHNCIYGKRKKADIKKVETLLELLNPKNQ